MNWMSHLWMLAIVLSFWSYPPSECTTQAPRLQYPNFVTPSVAPAASKGKGSPRPTFKFKYDQHVNVSAVVAMINPPNLYRKVEKPYKWYPTKDYGKHQAQKYGHLQYFDTPIFAGFPENSVSSRNKKWKEFNAAWDAHKHEHLSKIKQFRHSLIYDKAGFKFKY